MNSMIRSTMILCGLIAAHANAEITFYERENHVGRSFTVTDEIRNFARHGFNDRAESIYIGSGRYEVCSDADFKGDCQVLRSGSYDSLRSMGLANSISSVRRVFASDSRSFRTAPREFPSYEYHRRPREEVFQARVISVRAVYGEGTRRCWSERESSRTPNAGAAVAGAILGGIIGHQLGKGHGKDAATAAGAIAGAALGARGHDNTYVNNATRCTTTGSDSVRYYDVNYEFDGREYYAQMQYAPGQSILVNENGTPRQ